MQTRTASAVLTALFLAGCAATTPPPRFSAVGPADADAPEAGLPPPAPTLAAEPEAQVATEPLDAPKPATGHEGHAPSVTSELPEAAAVYTCTMHPEVERASAGDCPKCGMRLVRRGGEKRQP